MVKGDPRPGPPPDPAPLLPGLAKAPGHKEATPSFPGEVLSVTNHHWLEYNEILCLTVGSHHFTNHCCFNIISKHITPALSSQE